MSSPATWDTRRGLKHSWKGAPEEGPSAGPSGSESPAPREKINSFAKGIESGNFNNIGSIEVKRVLSIPEEAGSILTRKV